MKLYSGTDINIEVLNMKFTSIVFEKLPDRKLQHQHVDLYQEFSSKIVASLVLLEDCLF